MSEYTVVRDYPYPVEEVWQVLTDPELVGRWTTTGRGGRPEGWAAVEGTQFRFVGKPTLGWAGVVYCEVLSVDAPHRLHYTWRGEEGSDDVTDVTYRLEEAPGGTRFTWHHSGFSGVGGFAMSRLLGRVRRTMLTDGVPRVLEASPPLARGVTIDADGQAGREPSDARELAYRVTADEQEPAGRRRAPTAAAAPARRARRRRDGSAS